MNIQVRNRAFALAAVVAMAACADSTGVDDPQVVSLNFRVTEAPAPMAALAASAAPSYPEGDLANRSCPKRIPERNLRMSIYLRWYDAKKRLTLSPV